MFCAKKSSVFFGFCASLLLRNDHLCRIEVERATGEQHEPPAPTCVSTSGESKNQQPRRVINYVVCEAELWRLNGSNVINLRRGISSLRNHFEAFAKGCVLK